MYKRQDVDCVAGAPTTTEIVLEDDMTGDGALNGSMGGDGVIDDGMTVDDGMAVGDGTTSDAGATADDGTAADADANMESSSVEPFTEDTAASTAALG